MTEGRTRVTKPSRAQASPLVFPAISWRIPPAPGAKDTFRLENWSRDTEAIRRAARSKASELLILPEARWEEALTLLGRVREPQILATKAKLLDFIEDAEGMSIRVRGLEAVQLKALSGSVNPFARFTIRKAADPTIAPGINGDGKVGQPGEDGGLPAISWSVPLLPGKTEEYLIDWANALEAVGVAREDFANEILVVPTSRFDEAMETSPADEPPYILAVRAKILDVKEMDGGQLVRLKGLAPVRLLNWLDDEGIKRFRWSPVALALSAVGRNGDGKGHMDGSYVEGDPDRELEEQLMALPLPEETRKLIRRELPLLKRKDGDDEVIRVRRFFSLILSLPWGGERPPIKTQAEARAILDREHAGMEGVKEKVLDFVVAQQWWFSHGDNQGSRPRSNLLLVGPPGTGKTTIAQNIAEALNVPMRIVALGGMNDPVKLLGLDRGYVGAMPGDIIKSLQAGGSRHMVMVLDEIDKMAGANARGDCNGVLLSLVDESQNKGFRDHYLDIPFDLSSVTFIATANETDELDEALLDRFEIIHLRAFSVHEKLQMIHSHLLPRLYKASRVGEEQVKITGEALEFLVKGFNPDAGVRRLNQRLNQVVTRGIRRFLEDGQQVVVDKALATKLLSPFPAPLSYHNRIKYPGSSIYCFLSSGSGQVGMIETALIPRGKGKILLTGNLRLVTVESAKVAVSLVKRLLDGDKEATRKLANHDVHVHFPDAAFEKDGPSAGCALLVSIISAVTGVKPVDHLTMTGEISLHGEVMPIGGTVEKILGAERAGCTVMFVPQDNYVDVEGVPAEVLSRIQIIPVVQFTELLPKVFPGLNFASLFPEETLPGGEISTEARMTNQAA